ncbi:unnamed protein product [Cladocopium goreaui]|uniref:Reverse transcriptase domain-containing protein n=1 Tax=Cladocopium goreaui TaxID=2562237 RepID=A0A9P1DUH9_9DINO|nr:unnamed protein product [Cladocopium goreaui]
MSHEGFLQMPRPWCWGAGVPDVVSLVGSLLQQHGVPNNAAANRAKLLVQSLGMESIKQAVQGASPWKTLKSLANQQTPPFQLVLPDELNLVAQDRKTKKQKSAKMPSNKIAPSKPMDIDPTKLSLAQDTFHMDSGQPAPQLPASQVGPLAVGVALVTIQEALPFLQSGQLLTAKSLALLVINGPDELPTKLSWTSIRFAACCSVNQQPVLLHGHLVQLGAQPIVPVFTKESPGVHDVPVTCARVTVFADQWPQDWSSLADHPFKQVLQVLLPLQTCRSEDCQCGRWHPDGMDGNQDVILDVFRRQFFTEAGRPTKHAQANHFSVQIRYLKSQELALLRLSGQNGVFIEPRIQDASSPSDEFQVVWLPQASFASAQHQLQCEPMGLGLARSGRRFGLRVAAKDFQALFQKLKPEGQFLSPGTRQTWHCGPFPFGSDRKSIGRVFAEWKWQARPLQPAKPIANGVMWLVQSVTDPPQTVYNMQHGQVMISKCDSVRAGMADNGTVIGPQSTIELCASNTAVDPWTVQDPWQQALNQDRLQLMERQLQQLAHQHQTLESTVHEHHRQNSAQAKTPGPTAIDRTWTLGVCNPSGLQGKSVLLSGIDCDVINASETHLTATARSMLLSSLKSHSQYNHVITGALSQARINTTDAGQYTGVATIARVPTRALCAAWPQDLFETGRVQITGSLINNVWVSGAVMYGYPQGKTHQNAQSRSIEILDFLIDHMTQVATGPRYLCGDLNHEMDQLPNLHRLLDLGWKEAQDLEHLLNGSLPQHTCKGCTRKDMLWLSPELITSFRTVKVDHERFADHSVLRAEFDVDGAFAQRYLWPMPLPVPWTSVPPMDFPLDFCTGNPSALYHDLWTARECQAQTTLQHQWTPQMQGVFTTTTGGLPLTLDLQWETNNSMDFSFGRDPGVVPATPPSPAVAKMLCEAFLGEVRAFERTLAAAKTKAQSNAHRANPNLIYRDTKRPRPEPVTSLLVTKKTKVTELRPEDGAVLVDRAVDFDVSVPLLVDTHPVEAIHVSEDALYLADLSHVTVGSDVCQSQPVGRLDDVFAAFHTQWKKRWCKHDTVPASRWEQLIAFARHHLPQWPIPDTPITPALLRAEAASKKPKAATGLDGVSRADILQVDNNVLQSLCNIYQRAGCDGCWPEQIVTGSVASLAKREGACQTQDYRPITVFSMVYRVFSSIQARALLDHAHHWCHADIYGNRKHHQTAQLWRVLVTSIQQAYDQKACLSGLTADIEKCFNCLPRLPIVAAALHVGTPMSVMTAWCGALATMSRRFKVRDSFSDGFVTSTGLAEGCALSCYGMLLLDDIMHRYMAAQYPLLRVLSFVDNWDFLTWSADAAIQQLTALLEFANLTDLTVDREKTYAGYQSKLRALRTVAWPRGLFAVESAPVSDSTWLTIRRQANHALQMDKPGVNPLLMLGLVEAYADPEFVALIRTVAETRLNCPLDFWASDLYPLAAGSLDSPPSSPAAVLLGRVQKLGISVHPCGRWHDAVGTFHPALVNFTELCHRLQWHWNHYVSASVSHRKDFTGLQCVDTTLTRRTLAALPPDEQYYECCNTLDLRTKLAPEVVACLGLLPDAMVLRSWAILPPTHLAWLRLLDSIPSAVPSLAGCFRVGVVNEVFTDGSCLWQSDPSLRVASWGAVLAGTFSDTWNFQHGGVLGAGPVPGLCQTAYRGELFALAFVLHHASLGGFRVKIFCDNLGVVNRYHLLTQGKVMLKPNSASADLWNWVLQSLERLGTGMAEVVKVPAHRKLAQAKTRREAWVIWHNNMVDGVAKHANLDRSADFWTFWSTHARLTAAARVLHSQVCALHVAVAKRSVQTEAATTLDEAPCPAPKPLRVFEVKFQVDTWTGDLPLTFTNEYGTGLAHRIARWWKHRTCSTEAGEVRWITFAHLYVDYQLTFGCPGPIKSGRIWLDAFTRRYLDPEQHSFLTRLKWFRRCLKVFWKATNQQIGMAQCRATGDAIQSFVQAASLKWHQPSWQGAEHWLAMECNGPCIRGTKALQSLPLVKPLVRYALPLEAEDAEVSEVEETAKEKEDREFLLKALEVTKAQIKAHNRRVAGTVIMAMLAFVILLCGVAFFFGRVAVAQGIQNALRGPQLTVKQTTLSFRKAKESARELVVGAGNATAVGLSAAGTQTWHATKNAQRNLRDYGAAVRRTAKDWAEALRDPDWRQVLWNILLLPGRLALQGVSAIYHQLRHAASSLHQACSAALQRMKRTSHRWWNIFRMRQLQKSDDKSNDAVAAPRRQLRWPWQKEVSVEATQVPWWKRILPKKPQAAEQKMRLLFLGGWEDGSKSALEIYRKLRVDGFWLDLADFFRRNHDESLNLCVCKNFVYTRM